MRRCRVPVDHGGYTDSEPRLLDQMLPPRERNQKLKAADKVLEQTEQQRERRQQTDRVRRMVESEGDTLPQDLKEKIERYVSGEISQEEFLGSL